MGAPLGKSERGTRATFGGAWGSRTWTVVASRRRGAAGGGGAPRRRQSSEGEAERNGWRASGWGGGPIPRAISGGGGLGSGAPRRAARGGANGGRRRLWTPGETRAGARSRKESGGGGRELACEANGRVASRAEDEARVGRLGTSSSWRFGVHSRRACRERRRVARSRGFGRNQGRGKGWGHDEGTTRGRQPRRSASTASLGKQRRRWSEGKLVNNSKFQNFIL